VLNVISFISCQEDSFNESSIPYWRVSKIVHIGEHTELRDINTPVIIKDIGYKGHDIFVVRWNKDSFIAFDATCTNHANNYSHTTGYTKGDLGYKCKDCEIIFNMMSGDVSRDQNPQLESKVSIRNLQAYNCSYDSGRQTVYISNVK
jgi:hypothetical protein